MQHKKQRKVIRHKLPNLRQPGVKFDGTNRQAPLFFSKISNTLKLLQQPLLDKNKNTANSTSTNFTLKRKQTRSLRVNQLAKPKSKQKQNQQQVQKKQQVSKKNQRSMSLPYGYKKKQIKTRYSINQISRINNMSQTSDYGPNKQGEIIGTGLGLLPLQKILAQRQLYLKKKQKIYTIHTDSDSQLHENNQNNLNSNNNLDVGQEDFTPQDDFMLWLQKIIGNQGLFQKVSLFQRKKHKINHQNIWK